MQQITNAIRRAKNGNVGFAVAVKIVRCGPHGIRFLRANVNCAVESRSETALIERERVIRRQINRQSIIARVTRRTRRAQRSGRRFAAVVLQRAELRVNAGQVAGRCAADGRPGCAFNQIRAE